MIARKGGLDAVLFQKAFRQRLAYRSATLAALGTNFFFGLIRAFVFIALYASLESGATAVRGYDLSAVITYTALSQALIGPMMMWGSYEVMNSIRTGQIAMDLVKPLHYQRFWLARDLGRAFFELLGRGLPMLLAFGLIFDLTWPDSGLRWMAFLLSVALGVVVSFQLRFLVNLSAFWMLDAQGVARVVFLGLLLFTGLVMPLSFFPDWLAGIAQRLPFAAYVNHPTEIYLGIGQGEQIWPLLLHQAFWAIALGILGHLVFLRGLRRLVLQGG